MLTEVGDKVSDEEKADIQRLSSELKVVLDGEDGAAIKEAVDALQQSSMKLGEAMYKAQQEESESDASSEPNPSGSANGSSDADVVDADFEEVDDKEDKKSDEK
jgi:molecular chaperone DnaK